MSRLVILLMFTLGTQVCLSNPSKNKLRDFFDHYNKSENFTQLLKKLNKTVVKESWVYEDIKKHGNRKLPKAISYDSDRFALVGQDNRKHVIQILGDSLYIKGTKIILNDTLNKSRFLKKISSKKGANLIDSLIIEEAQAFLDIGIMAAVFVVGGAHSIEMDKERQVQALCRSGNKDKLYIKELSSRFTRTVNFSITILNVVDTATSNCLTDLKKEGRLIYSPKVKKAIGNKIPDFTSIVLHSSVQKKSSRSNTRTGDNYQ